MRATASAFGTTRIRDRPLRRSPLDESRTTGRRSRSGSWGVGWTDVDVVPVEWISHLGAGLLAGGQERVTCRDVGVTNRHHHGATGVAVADLGVDVAAAADCDVPIVVGDDVAVAGDTDAVVIDPVAADDERVCAGCCRDSVDVRYGRGRATGSRVGKHSRRWRRPRAGSNGGGSGVSSEFPELPERTTEPAASTTFNPLVSVSPVFPLTVPMRSLTTFESSYARTLSWPATSKEWSSKPAMPTARPAALPDVANRGSDDAPEFGRHRELPRRARRRARRHAERRRRHSGHRVGHDLIRVAGADRGVLRLDRDRATRGRVAAVRSHIRVITDRHDRAIGRDDDVVSLSDDGHAPDGSFGRHESGCCNIVIVAGCALGVRRWP